MINVKIAYKQNFLPERQYIIDVIFRHFLGIEYTVVEASDTRNSWLLEFANGSVVEFDDHFFCKHNEESGYIHLENIPSKAAFVKYEGFIDGPFCILYGDDKYKQSSNGSSKLIRFGNDIFAASFFMLSRWEEILREQRTDQYDRFDEAQLIAEKLGFSKIPIVNDYLNLLRQVFEQMGGVKLPLKEYKSSISHDVDEFARFGTLGKTTKVLAADVLKRRSFSLFKKNFNHSVSTIKGKETDPFDTFSYLMDESEKFGLKSTFYFIPGLIGEEDVAYNINDSEVINRMEEILSRGHQIGVHGAFQSYQDMEQYQLELSRLTAIIGPITHVRQHYLRLKLPTTWRIHNSLGLSNDSSMGFSKDWGFRCGVCYEYPLFDVIERCLLPIVERPITIMEAALVKTNPEPEQFLTTVNDIATIVKKHDGVFELLWHNSSFNVPEWEPFKNYYSQILNAIS